ncbi:YveK family protein, partial [Streptosporangium fragile]
MSPSPDDRPVRHAGGDLADYASLLRRRWPIALSLLIAGTGCGAALLLVTPRSYTASAQVLVTATGLGEQTNQVTNRQREALNLDTEAQVARSSVVAARAGRTLKGTPGPVEVSVPPNSSVLEISYTAAGPEAAAAGASAYAHAYLAHRGEAATQALQAQLKAVLAKLRQVNAGLAKAAAEIPGLRRGSPERVLALQRQNVLRRQASTLALRYDALKTVAVTPGSVISEAVPPTGPSAPSPPLCLGSGLMAGLLSGVGVSWLRDRLDTGLRTGADVKRLTGLDTVSGEEMRGLAGAVLVVAVPGTSSREVTRAARRLAERGVPVIGALVADPADAPAAGRGPSAGGGPGGPNGPGGPGVPGGRGGPGGPGVPGGPAWDPRAGQEGGRRAPGPPYQSAPGQGQGQAPGPAHSGV